MMVITIRMSLNLFPNYMLGAFKKNCRNIIKIYFSECFYKNLLLQKFDISTATVCIFWFIHNNPYLKQSYPNVSYRIQYVSKTNSKIICIIHYIRILKQNQNSGYSFINILFSEFNRKSKSIVSHKIMGITETHFENKSR